MIIIIPIGGTGERFKENGYKKPKALINIYGKPIISYLLDNLNTAKKKGWITIWIHPRFNTKKLYNFIDYSYPNIYDALNKINYIKFN